MAAMNGQPSQIGDRPLSARFCPTQRDPSRTKEANRGLLRLPLAEAVHRGADLIAAILEGGK